MFEEAKAEFETLKKTIAETIRSGRRPTSATLAEEDELRKKLFTAADRLSRRHRRLLPAGQVPQDVSSITESPTETPKAS